MTLEQFAEMMVVLREVRDLLKGNKPAAALGAGPLLPNYGKAKGQPIAGASKTDLEYYAAGCRKNLADEGKKRWWDKERATLAAIESELARQTGGTVTAPPDFGSADDNDGCPF